MNVRRLLLGAVLLTVPPTVQAGTASADAPSGTYESCGDVIDGGVVCVSDARADGTSGELAASVTVIATERHAALVSAWTTDELVEVASSTGEVQVTVDVDVAGASAGTSVTLFAVLRDHAGQLSTSAAQPAEGAETVILTLHDPAPEAGRVIHIATYITVRTGIEPTTEHVDLGTLPHCPPEGRPPRPECLLHVRRDVTYTAEVQSAEVRATVVSVTQSQVAT
jgi:hypothetical protein